MAKRKRKIVLRQAVDIGQGREYIVVKLTNSIEYDVGQQLREKETDMLCVSPAWEVVIQ